MGTKAFETKGGTNLKELFEQKYKENEKALFLVAVAYLRNTEDAKDILQESAISAYCAFDTLKNKEYFKTWITRIVINKCKNFLRLKRSTEELKDNLNIFYNIDESEIELMDAICKMNPKSSVYIMLKFYNDMTYEEIGKALKKPVSTVKYRSKRALCELKNILEGEYGYEQ